MEPKQWKLLILHSLCLPCVFFSIWEIWINPICFFLAPRGGFWAALCIVCVPLAAVDGCFLSSCCITLQLNGAAHCMLTACRAARTGSEAKWLQPPPQEASSSEVLDLEGFSSSRKWNSGRVKPDLCVWSMACRLSQMRVDVIVSSFTP